MRRVLAPSGLALALLASPGSAAVGPWVANEQAKVRLVSPWQVAPGGEELALGLEFELAPGWHVYWENSGDAGYPPKLDWSATPAIAAGPLRYPAPHRFPLPGGLMSFGYADAVIYPLRVRPQGAGGERLELRARLDYLVCASECIPYTAELGLVQPLGAPAADAATAARLELWERRLPRSLGELANPPRVEARIEPGDYPFSTLELALAGGGIAAAAPDLFFAVHPLYALGRPELRATSGGLQFRVPIRPLDETRPVPRAIDLAWTITGLEREGAELALAGTTSAALPSTPAARPLSRTALVAIAALAVGIATWLHFRRRHRRPPGN